jgi:hypothetical protein
MNECTTPRFLLSASYGCDVEGEWVIESHNFISVTIFVCKVLLFLVAKITHQSRFSAHTRDRSLVLCYESSFCEHHGRFMCQPQPHIQCNYDELHNKEPIGTGNRLCKCVLLNLCGFTSTTSTTNTCLKALSLLRLLWCLR